MQTISTIPPKPRKNVPQVHAEDYQVKSLKQAQAYMQMGKNKFRKLSIENGCLPIPSGNRYFYKLSSLNKFWDRLNLLNN